MSACPIPSLLCSERNITGHLANSCGRICIITLVRIKVTADITPTNASAQYELIALLTCLESSLGVVNACLPVTKPVFDKLKPTSLISALSGWTSIERGATSRDYKIAAKPKEISRAMENRPNRNERRNSQGSTINSPNAGWTPPLSPHKESQ